MNPVNHVTMRLGHATSATLPNRIRSRAGTEKRPFLKNSDRGQLSRPLECLVSEFPNCPRCVFYARGSTAHSFHPRELFLSTCPSDWRNRFRSELADAFANSSKGSRMRPAESLGSHIQFICFCASVSLIPKPARRLFRRLRCRP